MKKDSAERIKENILPKIKGKRLVKSGVAHLITDIEVEHLGDDEYATRLVGEDGRSAASPQKISLRDWLSENDNDLWLDYESMR